MRVGHSLIVNISWGRQFNLVGMTHVYNMNFRVKLTTTEENEQ